MNSDHKSVTAEGTPEMTGGAGDGGRTTKWKERVFVAALAAGVVLAMPTEAHAGLFGVFDEIFGTVQNDMGASLKTINEVTQGMQQMYQQAVWPLARINQARGFAANSISNYRGYMTQVFYMPFKSATLANPQQLESILHSRQSAQISALQTSFATNYGAVPQGNIASPQDRVMMDIDDALGQENLKTTLIADQGSDLVFETANQIENQVAVSAPGSSPYLTAQAQVANLRCQAFMQKMSDLPLHLDVADTDKVGRMYNFLRKELGDIFADRMAIEDFRGLFSGESVTKEMFEECQLVNAIYGDVASQVTERGEFLKQEFTNAQAYWESVRKSEDKEQRRTAVLSRNKAQAALWEYEQEARDQFGSLHLFVHYWAQGKRDSRRAWAQAMNAVVSNGRGSGAVLFQAFPQEVIDAFADATGGQRVRVRLPKTINGFVRFDDQQRAFLVERIENTDGPDGEKWMFLFQYKGKRTLIFDNTSVPAQQVRS